MDLRDIQEIASNEDVYLRGTHYFQQGKIMTMEWMADGRCVATVQGEQDTYRVVVDIGLHESIGYYSCSCQAFRNWYGACKHIVAVLLQICEEKIEKDRQQQMIEKEANDPKKEKEEPKKQIHQSLHHLIEWSVTENLKVLQEKEGSDKEKLRFQLVPTLRWGQDAIYYLSLTVGQNRQYIVKSISDFCRQVRSGEVVVYGKQPPVRHQIEDFEPQSAELAALILAKEKEYSLWSRSQNQNSMETFVEIGREMPMSPATLDDLFDIWQEKEIVFKDQQENKWVTSVKTQEPPSLLIQLQPGTLEDEVIIQTTPGKILHGERWNYLLQKEGFFRLKIRQIENIEKLLCLMEQNPAGLPVSSADMKDLDANILRPLEPFIVWQATEENLQKYRSQPLRGRIYIDQQDDGQIIGRLYFYYGEHQLWGFGAEDVFPGRDLIQEEKIKQLVLKYFPKLDEHQKVVTLATDDEALYRLLSEGVEELGSHMEVYASEHFRKMKIRTLSNVHVSIRMENDWTELSLDTEDISLEEWKHILQSYRLRKKYFHLKNGDFLKLEEEPMETMASLLEGIPDQLLTEGPNNLRLPNYRALFLERLFHEHPEIHCLKNENFQQMIQQIHHLQDNAFPIPASLHHTLRDYQKYGYQWLRVMQKYGFGGILADDMGLGKTIQMITLLLAEKQQSLHPKHTLIVCPASLIYNWQAEIQKFAPELTALALVGNSTERQEKIKQIFSYDVAITSYDLLRRDIEWYQNMEFDYHILDEAQYIKNQHTRSARTVRKIKSRQRFALTGTPIENNAAELWSVFDFLMPGYLYSYSHFKERFEKPIVKEGDAKALQRLNQMTAPFLLRRMKSEVLKELPDKNEMLIPSDMEPEQRKLYRANAMMLRHDFQNQIKQNGLASSKFMLLSILMRLRQLCCHPGLCYENYKGGSGKLELCMEIIKSSVASGHKILLFSQFTSMLAILSERLEKEKLPFYCLVGSTSKEARAQMVAEFQTNQVPIFLISLKAGGTGLNLTAADIVIHYDPWWNLSAQNQATDRVHRMGQKNSVQVYQLITKDSIEEKILHLQKKKKALADSIIGSGGNMISSMSAEEILSLLDEEV